jgi:hypothetical protein
MTITRERLNSISTVREFLRALLDPKKTPRVPKAIRKRAYWALRHFPGEYDMALTARKLPSIWGDRE